MSETRLLLKVEVVDGQPKVTLGTKHVALLSLALQVADLEVKDQIMLQADANASDIKIVPNGIPNNIIKMVN